MEAGGSKSKSKLAAICKIPKKGEDAVEASGVGSLLME